MVKIYSKGLDQSVEIDRIIGHIKGKLPGPTLVFIAGIHGNEPAGVFAMQHVLQRIKEDQISTRGSIYAISGNLKALANGKRFQKEDLNRIWTKERLEKINRPEPTSQLDDELKEQREIYTIIQEILASEDGPFYFMDLHTTSSKTAPFLTVNDSLLNRKFTSQYPIPIILGIEEYLNGPLLNYINELGYISFGYEGGQHDDPLAIQNHISFIYLTLVFSGAIKKTDIDYKKHDELLLGYLKSDSKIYEIYQRFEIRENEKFSMLPGFINFEPIKKGQQLAQSNGKMVTASKNGKIFMPLYQKQGDDGFFEIRSVNPIFLKLSAAMRKLRFDHIFTILPGVQWISNKKDELMVDLRIARFFTKQFFHLMGYRSKQIDKDHLRMKNRETASKTKEYRYTTWFK